MRGAVRCCAIPCYAPLCLCGAALYRMRMQLHRGGRGNNLRPDQCRKAAFIAVILWGMSECADHGGLPWPLRYGVPRAARRGDRVYLVFERRKALVLPFSLSPATSTAVTVRAVHLRDASTHRGALCGRIWRRRSAASQRRSNPSSAQQPSTLLLTKGEIMTFSARISSPHFVRVSCPAFRVSTVPCSTLCDVPCAALFPRRCRRRAALYPPATC